MNTVSVADLKQNLSGYLHLVERGESYVVTSHRRPVACISPQTESGLAVRENTVPVDAIRHLKGIKPDRPFDAGKSLYADRNGR